ncbi:MAG: hypothetical protein QOH42_990, partial [Blastocatellia bacterium]|nr:hypothetical protein [Blastocatellia bacterium]
MEAKNSQELDLADDGTQELVELLSGFLSSPNFSRPPRTETPSENTLEAIPDPLNHVARYRILVEQIPAIVFMAYLDDGIGEAYVSPHIEQVLGFTQEEWLDDPIMWFRQIHPDDKIRWSTDAANLFTAGEPLHSMYRVMARDGRVIWFQCEVKMVHREDGVPWFIHGVAIDVTELKDAEDNLRTAHDELELRVFERTAELASANEELEREIVERKRVEAERALLFDKEKEARHQAEAANRIKDEFLATVSHELRNPLNVILGYASVLLRIDGPEKWPQVRRAAEAIQRNALAQSQLVSDLLDMSRLQMGKLEINRQALSVAPIVKDAVDTVRIEAQAKNISLEMKLPIQSVFVYADSVRLRQVIWNLLNNAVKFTDKDGRVEISLESSDGEAKLSISDNGKGIDPQFLPYVFEMFRQG